MYFASRLQAGRTLAAKLVDKYRYEQCAVIALGDGGVMVGSQISKQLHCALNMLMSEEIDLPREPVAVGGITAEGNFIYNPDFSSFEIEEIVSESSGIIEQQKLLKMHEMNRLFGASGLISKDLLVDRNIILVSDGLKTSFSLELAIQFLKPIRIAKLIVATPMASVKVIDWMHLYADEIYCLSVLDDYISTNHYYDTQDIPDRAEIVKTLSSPV